MENVTLEKKNVFISYCHKDTTEEWIDKLATALGQYGINSIVDIYDLQLGQDLNYFMEQIKKVDKVLILLGETYKEKANEREGGVGTETQIISNDVYNDVEQTKFIPIVINKDENGNAYLPFYLEARLYTDFSDDNLFAKNIEILVRQIHKLPKRTKPIVLDPPQFLVQHRSKVGEFLMEDDVNFDELEVFILNEMENIKCTHDEYKTKEDEIILKKIEESREIRDIYIKNLWKMLDRNKVSVEDLISFFESAYDVANQYSESSYYNMQNDSCHFFLQEIIIYTVAVLYKKKKYKEISQLIKTTYFPAAQETYDKNGITLDYFCYHLNSLDSRNYRLQLDRKSIHADLMMQRAAVPDININFSDIRFIDCLILMLIEWFYKVKNKWINWYPVTIVYARYDNYLQLKKYLVSKSRFDTIRELFAVNDKEEFLKRYKELALIYEGENRTSNYGTLPSICSVVKLEDLFSKE